MRVNSARAAPSLGAYLGRRHRQHVVLPAEMVVAVDPDLEAAVPRLAQNRLVASADVGRWQQRAVEQGAHAVKLDDARPPDLLQEPRTEHPPDRLARVPSGPRLKRKQAGTSSSESRLTNCGTPMRVPRSVSTSILSARVVVDEPGPSGFASAPAVGQRAKGAIRSAQLSS